MHDRSGHRNRLGNLRWTREIGSFRLTGNQVPETVSLRISLKHFRYDVFSGALIVMPSHYGELSAYIELIQLCNLCHELKPTVVMTDEITEPH